MPKKESTCSQQNSFRTRYTVFDPPVLSDIDDFLRKSVSSSSIRRKPDPEYLEYCRDIQLNGTNLLPKEDEEKES